MFIRRYALFAQFIQIGLIVISITAAIATKNRIGNSQSNDRRHEHTLSECAARGGECDERRGRPICGTDDQTYPSRCHLLRVQCSGYQVSLKYKGPCRACKDAREYAMKHKRKNPPNFIPRCKADGTYAPVQCLVDTVDTGCWCSDLTGKPIEKTSVRTGRPHCHKYSKANLRRSPARRVHSQRFCTPQDRTDFNANLINNFYSEYIRFEEQQNKNIYKDNNSNTNNRQSLTHKQILEWKFSQLDTNRNQTLDKNEFREVKKLVKRVIRPRRCGRTFGKFCDVDGDDRLTRKEWNNCIFKNESYRETSILLSQEAHQKQKNIERNKVKNKASSESLPQTIVENHEGPNQFNFNNMNVKDHGAAEDTVEDYLEGDDRVDYENEADYDFEENHDHNNLSLLNKSGGPPTIYPSIYILRPAPEAPAKELDIESLCLSEQAAALEEQKNGGSIFYVPECTPDGRFQRVQCYRSTPYCWCVNEDTGKNIPGTSVKDKRPICDAFSTLPRPMKGCPEVQRIAFLKDLNDFLRKSILFNNNGNAVTNSTKWKSEHEQISTLTFLMLDKNKSKTWERREWKLFRELISSFKNLRKCGRKLPRYCDVNNDKRVTLAEWLDCLQTDNIMVESVQTTTQKNETMANNKSKLNGFNPLDQYLKD